MFDSPSEEFLRFLTLLLQYLLTAPKYPIDTFLSNESQTIYGVISMPATVMILVSKFILHPLLTRLTGYVKKKDYKQFNSTIVKLSGFSKELGSIF